MWINLLLAAVSVVGAVAFWNQPGTLGGLAFGLVALCGWQLFCAITHRRRPLSPVILRLAGFSWTIEDFCRGWLGEVPILACHVHSRALRGIPP